MAKPNGEPSRPLLCRGNARQRALLSQNRYCGATTIVRHDLAVKGGMPLCPMCEQDTPKFHKKSHILPKWMHKETKDNLGRVISVSFEDDRAEYDQSGRSGSYWCDACEVESSWSDDYAYRVLTKAGRSTKEARQVTIIPIIKKENRQSAEYVYWRGLEYKELSRFVVICCIRAHLDRVSKGQPQLLTDTEFRALRFCYRSNFIDDKTFPIFGFVEPDDAQYRVLLCSPVESRMGGKRCISFKGPGVTFALQLEGAESNDPSFTLLRLKTNGEMITILYRYEQTQDFRKTLPKFQAILKKYPPEKFGSKRANPDKKH